MACHWALSKDVLSAVMMAGHSVIWMVVTKGPTMVWMAEKMELSWVDEMVVLKASWMADSLANVTALPKAEL